MSTEFYNKWQNILEDVEKSKIPIQFIKKIILKFQGKRQQTINIQTLLKQGLEPEEVEEIVNRKLIELDHQIVNLEFILNVENIADTVQPETDKLLGKL
jgi:hypothetical protein